MSIDSVSLVFAPVGVIVGAVIAAAVARWTTTRIVQSARHSAHADRQLEALYGFLDVVAALGALHWGLGAQKSDLDEKRVRLRMALQRAQVVSPTELQTLIHTVNAAALDVITYGRFEKPYYEAELSLRMRTTFALLGREGVLTEGAVVSSTAEGFDGPAAMAFQAVSALYEAEQGVSDDERQAIVDRARTALDRVDGLTALQRHLLIDGRVRERELETQRQFEDAQNRLEFGRAELIDAANRWLLHETSRKGHRGKDAPPSS
ncbi:hypothetical protein ACWEQ3_46505 [Streptomyces mirabilis]